MGVTAISGQIELLCRRQRVIAKEGFFHIF